jgi:membrane protease YdiL (CAAX protease family)
VLSSLKVTRAEVREHNKGQGMNRKLAIFTLATCAFSWTCWLPIIDSLESSPFAGDPLTLALFFLGAYGPTLVGLAMTGIHDGRSGVKNLLRSAVSLRIGARWIVVALLTGPILYSCAAAAFVLLGGDVGAVNLGLLPWLPIVFVVPIVFGPLAEEFGWRGFALPLLDHRNKAIASSLIIGFIWALWHAPLFWAQTGTAISGFTIDAYLVTLFFLAVIGSSFIYTWLFNHTGSLAAAILLHLGMNASGTITGMLFPEMSPAQKLELYEIYVVVLWFLVLAGSALSRARRGVPARVAS